MYGHLTSLPVGWAHTLSSGMRTDAGWKCPVSDSKPTPCLPQIFLSFWLIQWRGCWDSHGPHRWSGFPSRKHFWGEAGSLSPALCGAVASLSSDYLLLSEVFQDLSIPPGRMGLLAGMAAWQTVPSLWPHSPWSPAPPVCLHWALTNIPAKALKNSEHTLSELSMKIVCPLVALMDTYLSLI